MTDGGFDGGGHGGDGGHDGFDGSGIGHSDGYGFHGFDGVHDGDHDGVHHCFDFGPGDAGHTFDALVVSHSFCSHHAHTHSGNFDNSVDIGHAQFGGHGNLGAIGGTFTGALDPSKELFGLRISGHRYVDLCGRVEQSLRSRNLMELYTPQGGRQRVQPRTFEGILPQRAATSTKPAIMPAGWYPGATGLTTQLRSFWQLGKQTLWDKLSGKPLHLDSGRRWNIDVSITLIYFSEADDYETVILVNVWSPHMGRNSAVQDRSEHLAAARSFIKEMAELLAQCAPTERSIKSRRQFGG